VEGDMGAVFKFIGNSSTSGAEKRSLRKVQARSSVRPAALFVKKICLLNLKEINL